MAAPASIFNTNGNTNPIAFTEPREAIANVTVVAEVDDNGHRGALAVKLTAHGPMLVCRTCGKAAA